MNGENKFSVDEILEAERKAKANGAPEESERESNGQPCLKWHRRQD